MGDEDFLAAVEADNANTPVEEPKEPEPVKEPEPEAEPAKEPEPGPARDEHGKFKAKEPEATPPEPEPQPPPEPAAAIPPQPEPPHAPLTALLDERERRQKAEQLAEQHLRELERIRASQQPEEAPDPRTDPEGFARYQQTQFQNVLLNERLNTSERFARKEHGLETVEKAKEWAKQQFAADPLYVQQIYGNPDPYEKLVSDYQREQLVSQVSPSDFEEFRAWKAAKGQLAQAQPGATAPPTTPAPPAIPPRSLASAPSAGGVLTEPELTDQDIFEGVIPKG